MKWLVPLGVGAALVLSACGDGSTASTTTVVNLESTNYHTLPPTQSTAPPTTKVPGGGTGNSNPGDTTPQGGTVAGEQSYTIGANDVPFTVAKKFGITVDALALANAGTPGYGAFYPGLVIKIPAGAKVPPATTTPPTTPGQTTTTLKGGGSNLSFQLRSGHVHHRRRRHPQQGRQQVQPHRAAVGRRQREHARLQGLHRRHQDHHPAEVGLHGLNAHHRRGSSARVSAREGTHGP